MKAIRMTPNESGAYGTIQEGGFSKVPEGMAEWPDSLSTESFYAYKGFVTLGFEEVKEGEIFQHYRVALCEPNVELFEAWEAEHPETEPEPEEEPSVWDELDKAYQEGVDSV